MKKLIIMFFGFLFMQCLNGAEERVVTDQPKPQHSSLCSSGKRCVLCLTLPLWMPSACVYGCCVGLGQAGIDCSVNCVKNTGSDGVRGCCCTCVVNGARCCTGPFMGARSVVNFGLKKVTGKKYPPTEDPTDKMGGRSSCQNYCNPCLCIEE